MGHGGDPHPRLTWREQASNRLTMSEIFCRRWAEHWQPTSRLSAPAVRMARVARPAVVRIPADVLVFFVHFGPLVLMAGRAGELLHRRRLVTVGAVEFLVGPEL